jgi:hypothetical protein
LKIPFIFDLQNYYPTTAAGYILNVHSLCGTVVKGAFESMTQALLRMADVVMVPGIAHATYARAVCGKVDPRVYIVPNSISEHLLRSYDGNRVREKLGYEEEDLVVSYVGSIEFWLDMRTHLVLVQGLSRRAQD